MHRSEKPLLIIRMASEVLIARGKPASDVPEFLRKASIKDFEYFGERLAESSLEVEGLLGRNQVLRSWNEFGKEGRFDLGSSLGKAALWVATVYANEGRLIESHERIRSRVERSFMNGNYEKVIKYLDRHERVFGKTFWCHRWRLSSISAGGTLLEFTQFQKETTKISSETPAGLILSFMPCLLNESIPPKVVRRTLREYFQNSGNATWANFTKLILLDEIPDLEDERTIVDLISCLELLPVVDRHHCFMRLATHALSQNKWVREFTRGLKVLTPCSIDAQIVIEKEHFGVVHSGLSGKYFDSIECWDSYFCGSYDEADLLAENAQKRGVYDFGLLELQTKSRLYKEKNRTKKSENVEWITQTIEDILNRNDIEDRIYDKLDQFVQGTGFEALSAQVRAFIRGYSGKGSSESLEKLAYLRSHHFSPRFNEDLGDSKLWKSHLEFLRRKKPKSQCVIYLHKLIAARDLSQFEIASYADPIPNVRQRYFEGLIALKLGFLKNALASINKFIEEFEKDPTHERGKFALDQALALRAEVFRLLSDAESAQSVVVELYNTGASAFKRLDLRAFYRLSYQKRKELGGTLDFPILAWLAGVGPHEVCLGIKRVMRFWGVDLPSDLLELDLPFKILTVKTFFEKVCTVENLDSISSLDTIDKVDEERLRILGWIEDTFGESAPVVERERLKLIQASQLRHGLDRIDDNKLAIDLPSLQDAERSEIETIFQDYVSRLELALASLTGDIEKLIDAARTEGGKPQGILLRGYREAFVDAKIAAFDALREIFIRSPQFGLEGCLSGRIRHGIVVEHIIKPLKSQDILITERYLGHQGSAVGWAGDFTDDQSEQAEEAKEVLRTLTEQVAEEAGLFRDEIIQTSVEDDDDKAAFHFYFEREEIRKVLSEEVDDHSDWRTFSFSVFSMLTQRTQECLAPLRLYISDELKPRILSHFDSAIRSIEGIGEFHSLHYRVVKSKQEMEGACEAMISWFQDLTGTIGQDVTFDFVSNTAIGMLERLHPEYSGGYKGVVDGEARLNGKYFTTLVHVIYFLIENGVKHTDLLLAKDFSGVVEVRVEGGRLAIRVDSRMSSAQAAEHACEKISERLSEIDLDANPGSAIIETNSGFAKILSAMKFEFKDSEHALTAKAEGESVSVSVGVRLDVIAR